MVQINEMSMRARLDRATLVAFMSKSLGVGETRIGTSNDFLELVGTAEEKALGLDVLLSDSGFQTLCRWYKEGELSPPDLLELAAKASVAFQTDTVFANYLEPPDVSTDQFLLVTPERKVFRAYATVNTDVFDVELVDGKEISLDNSILMFRHTRQEETG
ncbi:MAG TPA: hypothetical protein VH682_19980 [Gemmataceae bacterium]|jgi:hypothetical protein